MPAKKSHVESARYRMVVLNGQRIVQVQDGQDWAVLKVGKANGLRPAIYNLFTAVQPDKETIAQGPILHADRAQVWQELSKGSIVVHSASSFDKVPEIGAAVSIKYDASARAQVEMQQAQTRSRSR